MKTERYETKKTERRKKKPRRKQNSLE